MNKKELEKLVDIRLKEATTLFNNKCYEGAYYLLGYALECAVKACITKQVKENDFPDKELANKAFTHDLGKLIGVAGLTKDLDAEKLDEDFKLNWAVAMEWSEQTRYDNQIAETKVNDFFEAVTNNQKGILLWIKRWW